MIRPARDKDIGLVCIRVDDVRPTSVAQGSTKRQCAACDRDVWVSPASAKAAGPDALALCVQCFRARALIESGPVKIQRPSGEQIDELWEHFRP